VGAVRAVDSIARSSVVRAMLTGIAGSGKTTMIRYLHRLLSEDGVDVVRLTEATAIAAIPTTSVLLVDDAHLLDERSLDGLVARAADHDAGLIVAARPWPRTDGIRELTRRLDQERPVLLLGQLSRGDVAAALASRGVELATVCIDELLRQTSAVPWLMSEALRAHEDGDGDACPDHASLTPAILDRIAHRLDTVDPSLRRTLEQRCIAPHRFQPMTDAEALGADAVSAQGYAEGLLLRNGQPIPLVATAVRAAIAVHRLAGYADDIAEEIGHPDSDDRYREWIAGARDARIAAALVTHADAIAADAPSRAAQLYRSAIACGADRIALSVRRARVAWAEGDLDEAAVLLEGAGAPDTATEPALADDIADMAAAVWSARGIMRMSCAVHRAHPPGRPTSTARAVVAGLGAGEPFDPASDASAPPTSTLGVAMDLLARGTAATLAEQPSPLALSDLVRAAEIYTASRTSEPIAELPAVIAAVVALTTGDLDTARATIDAALDGGHGGRWARRRLLLWRAWIAVQSADPDRARDALRAAQAGHARLSPRDDFLARAVAVAIARRYEDKHGLASAWQHARPSLVRTEPDAYLLLPLAELITAAARLGESALTDQQFGRALEIVGRLGSPQMWATHLHWAGIQRSILLNRPDGLASHARALVALAGHSPVAATMAQSGRIWTAVLGGSVDPDAVEQAAQSLARIGLTWDAARLAGHGAGRSSDRKASARLLACARDLHPQAGRAAAAPAPAAPAASAGSPETNQLSEREWEVARLVVLGKTYAEIGETIFISPRTAEHHIAHIRRRLGATSRSDLIARLRALIDPAATEATESNPLPPPSPFGETPDSATHPAA